MSLEVEERPGRIFSQIGQGAPSWASTSYDLRIPRSRLWPSRSFHPRKLDEAHIDPDSLSLQVLSKPGHKPFLRSLATDVFDGVEQRLRERSVPIRPRMEFLNGTDVQYHPEETISPREPGPFLGVCTSRVAVKGIGCVRPDRRSDDGRTGPDGASG